MICCFTAPRSPLAPLLPRENSDSDAALPPLPSQAQPTGDASSDNKTQSPLPEAHPTYGALADADKKPKTVKETLLSWGLSESDVEEFLQLRLPREVTGTRSEKRKFWQSYQVAWLNTRLMRRPL